MMKEVYYRSVLTTSDLILTPIYILAIIAIGFFIRNLMMKNDNPLRSYFIPGLFLKLCGGVGVGVVYYFYYTGGDTTEYYNNAIVMYGAFNDSPYYFFKLLMAPPGFTDPAIYNYKYWMFFHHDPAAWFYSKFCGVASLLSFDVYSPMACVLAFACYGGVWALYVTFCKIYPDMYKKFAIAVLFIPSVFFWGSGLLKDSVTFSCVGWITYASYNIFFSRRKVVLNAMIFLLATYVCLRLKAYIVFSVMPAVVFWIFLYYRSRFKSAFLRFVLGPVAMLSAAFFGYLIINRLGAEYRSYSIQGAIKTAETFQEWHDWLAVNANASGYSLGSTDGSFLSIASKIPAAVNVTLFRPYPWEVRNPVMLLSALESFVMMLFTIRIFWRTGLRLTIKSLASNPTAFFCIFFSVFFSFAVGFSAYNFGALVRYKIPCIPFFVAGLYILDMQTAQARQQRKETKLKRRHNWELNPQT